MAALFTRIRRRCTAWWSFRRSWTLWHGARLHFPAGSLIARQILLTGGWEQDIGALLATGVKPQSTVFDIGANIGSSALPLLEQFPEIQVISFEPSPSVLPYLHRTRDASPFRKRWEIVTRPAAAKEGMEIPFTVFGAGADDVYAGFRDTGRAAGRKQVVNLVTTSVDAEWNSRGRPPVSAIKIDVEGGELEVLAGAEECLRSCRPTVITEWCPKNFSAYGHRPEAMLQMSAQMGYAVYLIPEIYRITDPQALPFQLCHRENLLLLPLP